MLGPWQVQALFSAESDGLSALDAMKLDADDVPELPAPGPPVVAPPLVRPAIPEPDWRAEEAERRVGRDVELEPEKSLQRRPA